MRDSSWGRIALGDTGTWLSGGTPRTTETRFWGGEIPWISASSLKDFVVSDSDRRVTDEGARSGTRLVPPGTVLCVVRGMSLKTEFRIGVAQREVAFGQDCKAIIAHPHVDPDFLAYAMVGRTEEILNLVDEAGHGTGRLSTDLLQALEIDLPPLDVQRNIARTLRSLDAKRVHSGVLATTCLDLAQSLHEQASATPPSREGTFSDFADVGGGGTPSTKVAANWSGPVRWATPTDVTRLSHPYMWETERTLTRAGLAACASPEYPAGSILMTSRATIGAFAVAQQPMAVNQGFVVVQAKEPMARWFIFHEMRSRVDEMLARANGSTFLELSRSSFKSMAVALPSLTVLREFDAKAELLHERATRAIQERVAVERLLRELTPALTSGAAPVGPLEVGAA